VQLDFKYGQITYALYAAVVAAICLQREPRHQRHCTVVQKV